MSYFETFSATFSAIIIGQGIIWFFNKYIAPILDQGHEQIQARIKMTNKKIKTYRIEETNNKGIIIDRIEKANLFAKTETQTYIFNDLETAAEFIKEDFKQ